MRNAENALIPGQPHAVSRLYIAEKRQEQHHFFFVKHAACGIAYLPALGLQTSHDGLVRGRIRPSDTAHTARMDGGTGNIHRFEGAAAKIHSLTVRISR